MIASELGCESRGAPPPSPSLGLFKGGLVGLPFVGKRDKWGREEAQLFPSASPLVRRGKEGRQLAGLCDEERFSGLSASLLGGCSPPSACR